jgi:hypothetical protein
VDVRVEDLEAVAVSVGRIAPSNANVSGGLAIKRARMKAAFRISYSG